MVTMMKSYFPILLLGGFALLLAPSCAAKKGPSTVATPSQMDSLVKMDLRTCAQKVPVVAQGSAKAFPQDRIERTLNGIWRGRVSGDYDKQYLGPDGFLNVDYYMIVDVKKSEILVLEQLSSKRAAPAPTGAAPATWSFLMCGQDRYLPRHPKQIHEFQKVSNNVEDA